MSPGSRSGWTTLALAVAIALAEPIAYLAIAIALEAPTSIASLNERKEQVLREARRSRDREVDSPGGPAGEVVHPYLGFAGDGTGPLGAQSLGFGEREPVLRHRSADQLLVAITGGAFAREFVAVAGEVLASRLASTPALAGRKLVILPLTHPDWKQPQPLLALEYLLVLGGELDVLINIDGRNEVALHAVENQRRGVSPSFPHGWYGRARSLPDPVVLPILGRIAYLEAGRAEWARRMLRAPLRWSALAGGIWLVRDRKLGGEIADAQRILREVTTAERGEPWLGPQVEFASEAALYEELVSVWSRSSLQLSQLCRANGIGYLHFLEPDPIASGANGIGRAGRRAESVDPPVGVVRGYPLLRRECAQLAAGGVPCRELTPGGRGDESPGSIVAERLIEELASRHVFDTEIRH